MFYLYIYICRSIKFKVLNIWKIVFMYLWFFNILYCIVEDNNIRNFISSVIEIFEKIFVMSIIVLDMYWILVLFVFRNCWLFIRLWLFDGRRLYWFIRWKWFRLKKCFKVNGMMNYIIVMEVWKVIYVVNMII